MIRLITSSGMSINVVGFDPVEGVEEGDSLYIPAHTEQVQPSFPSFVEDMVSMFVIQAR